MWNKKNREVKEQDSFKNFKYLHKYIGERKAHKSRRPYIKCIEMYKKILLELKTKSYLNY